MAALPDVLSSGKMMYPTTPQHSTQQCHGHDMNSDKELKGLTGTPKSPDPNTIRHAKTIPIHGVEGSATNALVLDTTSTPPRGHVSMTRQERPDP